jgi:hypothetical protein
MVVRLSALSAGCTVLPRNFFSSGTHLCWRLSKPQGLVQLEGIGKLKMFNELTGTRTRDLPAHSTVPQPTTLPHAPSACLIDKGTVDLDMGTHDLTVLFLLQQLIGTKREYNCGLCKSVLIRAL